MIFPVARAGLFASALLLACTSTLDLGGDLDTVDSGEADATSDVGAGDEDTRATDASTDSPLVSIPELVLPPKGTPTTVIVKLEPNHEMARLTGPDPATASNDGWICGTSEIGFASDLAPFADVRIVNSFDSDASVVLELVGDAYAEGTVQRGDVALALYTDANPPSDRRLCAGAMKVNCTSSVCGSTDAPPVPLALFETISVPRQSSVVISVYGLIPGKYGTLGVAAGIRP